MSARFKQGLFIVFSLLLLLPASSTLAQDAADAKVENPDVDSRRNIVTRPNERAHILHNMRQYLIGLRSVVDALGRDDMLAAAKAARTMGSINLYEVRLMFPNRAALEFRDLAYEVHMDFDALAKDTEEKKDARQMLSQLAPIMKKCAHCHETYRMSDSAH